jgi:hypothetical protein
MSGEHLSPKTRELLDRPMEERVAHIQKDSWIPYSQASRILQHLEDLLNHPRCDRMPNLAISAQTNNGKTRLMKHFSSLRQATEASGGTVAKQKHFLNALRYLANELRISIVSCRWLAPHVPCPVPRPLSVWLASAFIAEKR